MSPKLLAILLLFASLSCTAAGDYLAKAWSVRPVSATLYAVLGCSLCSTLAWAYSLRNHGQISAIGVIWSLGNVAICLLIGWVGFGEALSLRQWIGCLLAIAASLLMF